MLSPDQSNIHFQFAWELVNYSSRNLFLTGKAGTGKTTFLKYVKSNCAKQIAVVAPTGVAAINAGGVTIHSFFQLPLSPFVPGRSSVQDHHTEIHNKHSLLGRMKVNNEKRKIFQELELLIIDEISMVRCDTLDAIDTVLRHFRNRYHEPFGGIQVLLIGDMHQLPPVVPADEWNILSQFYKNPYFFSSNVIQQQPPLYIEFEKIYRQSEEQFIQLLNQVRNNALDEYGMQLLRTRCQPQFQPDKEEGYIILTTHNYKADSINAQQLSKLNEELFSFPASIDGEFYEKAYPADELLQLKPGAQVMFIKNDSEKNRRYFNGKIGTVIKKNDDKIFVQCKDDSELIEVRRERWENIRYTLNKTTQHLEEEVIGSFSQFPLRLAWAVTIHKSQGLTFEKAIIDAGLAFAPGQVYVALSRCTSLDGLILHSQIKAGSLFTDEHIATFSLGFSSLPQLEQELREARHHYQNSLLLSLFNFTAIVKNCNDLLAFVMEHTSSFNANTITWIEELITRTQALQQVAEKFKPQLLRLLQQEQLPEENSLLQQRLIASSKYFFDQLQIVLKFLQQSPAVTDSWQLAKQYDALLQDIHLQLSQTQHQFSCCREGFDAKTWHNQKKEFKVPSFNVNAYAGAASYRQHDNPHPGLYQQLRKLRDAICAENDQPIYIVAGSRTLDEMARYLPQNIEELRQISGFGKAKIEAYGKQFIELIQKYCGDHQLTSLIHEKSPKRQRKEKKGAKTDTKLETFTLYKQGKSVAEIAAARNFTTQTIEGHLAHYVQQGIIQIDELVSREKLVLIEPKVSNFENGSLTTIKNELGESISFGEIRLVMAWLDFQKKSDIADPDTRRATIEKAS